MKLLATGDLHVGQGYNLRSDALADQREILKQIFLQAREHDVDALLVAGDVFHRPKPTPAELHVFADFAGWLATARIPAYAVMGDVAHDQTSVDTPTALELFDSAWFRVSRAPELIRAAGDLAIATLPAVPITRLVATAGGGDRGQILDAASEMLLTVARGFRADVPAGWPSVLLGHWALRGAALPNGMPVEDFGKPMLDPVALAELGFDAVVMGDIHRPQLIGEGPDPMLYVGSPGTWDFGEVGYDHGAWLLTLVDGVFEAELLLLSDRRFVTVDADLTGDRARIEVTTPEDGYDRRVDMDETDFIAAMISEELPLADAIVRVRYRATEAQHRRVDQAALRGFIADAGGRCYQIAPEIIREARARAEHVDESLDPLTAVEAWCDANEIAPEEAAALAELTRELLEDVAA